MPRAPPEHLVQVAAPPPSLAPLVHKEPLVPKDPKVSKENLVLRQRLAQRGLREHLARREQQVQLALQELSEPLVQVAAQEQQELKVLPAHKDQQALPEQTERVVPLDKSELQVQQEHHQRCPGQRGRLVQQDQLV